MAALQAELEAARAVSEVEVRKRVAAEHQVALLQRRMTEAGLPLSLSSGAEGGGGGGGGGAEGGVCGGGEKGRVEGREGGREEEGEDEEVTALVIKEQLLSLRDLKPAFHKTWAKATTEWKVRGETYMYDGVKVGGKAAQPLCELVHMELLDVESAGLLPRADHVTSLFQGLDGVYTRCQLLASRPPPFLLILNFQVPGNPPCSMMCYFALSGAGRKGMEKSRRDLRRRRAREIAATDAAAGGGGWEGGEGGRVEGRAEAKSFGADAEEERRVAAAIAAEEEEEEGVEEEVGMDEERRKTKNQEKKFLKLLAEFLEGSDEEKNARFKLIPSMVEGPRMINFAVGNKPVLLGKKLTQRYWSGPGYLEVGIDIGSSIVASRTLGLVRDYSKNIVVELAVLVQGEEEAELPEKVLGSLRCSRLDWGLAENLKDRLEAAQAMAASTAVSPVPSVGAP